MNSAILKWLSTLPKRLVAIVIFLLGWELIVRTGLIYPAPVPTASHAISVLIEMALAGTLWKHAAISLQRAFSGYALAILIAIPLGLAIGWFKTFERYIDPLIQTFRQVPLIAWFPVFIIFLGEGELSITCVLMLAAIWWILLSTISGVHNVDPFIVKFAMSAGASELDMLRKIVLPSAIPSIFTGLRYAYTEVIIVSFAIEMLGVNAGLGNFMINGECHSGLENIMIYSIGIFMVIVGLIANYMLVAFEKWLCRWKDIATLM